MDCGERGSLNGFLATALLLTKNVAPQAVTHIGSNLATGPSAITGITLPDVCLYGCPHSGCRSGSLRRRFCSRPRGVFPRLCYRLLESQRSFGRFVVDVVGNADRRLLVVGSVMVIAPAHEPNAAPLALAIPKVRLGIEAAPMDAKLQPAADISSLGAMPHCGWRISRKISSSPLLSGNIQTAAHVRCRTRAPSDVRIDVARRTINSCPVELCANGRAT